MSSPGGQLDTLTVEMDSDGVRHFLLVVQGAVRFDADDGWMIDEVSCNSLLDKADGKRVRVTIEMLEG